MPLLIVKLVVLAKQTCDVILMCLIAKKQGKALGLI